MICIEQPEHNMSADVGTRNQINVHTKQASIDKPELLYLNVISIFNVLHPK